MWRRVELNLMIGVICAIIGTANPIPSIQIPCGIIAGICKGNICMSIGAEYDCAPLCLIGIVLYLMALALIIL